MIHIFIFSWFIFFSSWALGAEAPELVKQWQGISEYRLANGMRVVAAPDTSAGTIHFNLIYRTGSLADSEFHNGTAHLLEHMMFKGTLQRTAEQLVTEQRKRGIRCNATTSFDRTRYSAVFEADPAKLDYMLALEAERMTGLLLSETDVNNEIQVVRQEIARFKDEPLGALGQSLLAKAWDGKGYGRTVLGTYDTLGKITAEVLRQFHQQYYQPDNATLVITGGFDPATTLDAIKRHFSGITSSRLTTITPVSLPSTYEAGITEVHHGQLNAVMTGYELPPAEDSRNTALMVLADVFAGEPHGRLYQALVVPGKAQGVFALQQAFQHGGQFLFGVILTEGQSHQAVQQALLEQIEGLRTHPVTEDELRRAKDAIRPIKTSLMSDPATLSETLSESVAVGDWQLQLRRFDEVEALDLRPVQKQSQALLANRSPVIGHLLAEQDLTASRPAQLLRQPADATLPNTTSQATLVSAAKMPDVADFNAYVMAVEQGIQRSQLNNGMKIALRPLPKASGPVQGHLNLRFGDLKQLRGQQAVSDLAGTLLIRGSQTLSHQDIVDRANRLGAGFSIVPNGGVLTVRFESPKDSLPELLELITEVLQQPSFPLHEFELVKRQRLQALRTPANTPAAVAGLELRRQVETYAQGDIRQRVEPEEMLAAVDAVSHDDVQRFHESFYGAQHGELAISGDFEVEQVQTQLNTLFGSWMSKAPYRREPVSYQEITPGRHQIKTMASSGYYIGRLYFPANGASDDAAALFIAEHILGRHPITSRLGQRIREQEQLSYHIHSSIRIPSSGDAAWLSVQGDFSAGEGIRLADIIMEEIAKLADSGITQDELNIAKTTILGERQQQFRKDHKIQEFLPGQLHEGVTMSSWVTRNNAFASVTLEHVNDVIRRYFKTGDIVEIIAEPGLKEQGLTTPPATPSAQTKRDSKT